MWSWFNGTKMTVNLGNFQAIVIRENHKNETFKIGSKEVKVVSPIKILGVEIDHKLNFEQQINRICKSIAKQLKVLIRLKRFLGFPWRKPY